MTTPQGMVAVDLCTRAGELVVTVDVPVAHGCISVPACTAVEHNGIVYVLTHLSGLKRAEFREESTYKVPA